jgi:hypothetical protein
MSEIAEAMTVVIWAPVALVIIAALGVGAWFIWRRR